MKHLAVECLFKKREDQDSLVLCREGFFFSKARAKVLTLKLIFKWEREEEKLGSSTFGANLFLLSACHHMSFMLETETNTLSKYFRHLLLKQISLTGEKTDRIKEGGKQRCTFINDVKILKILSRSIRTYFQDNFTPKTNPPTCR